MDYEIFDKKRDELEKVAANEPDKVDGFFYEMLPNYKRK